MDRVIEFFKANLSKIKSICPYNGTLQKGLLMSIHSLPLYAKK